MVGIKGTIAAVCLLVAAAQGRSAGGSPPSFDTLHIDELERLMASDTGMVVVDVRVEAKYRRGHIPGARHVPLSRVRAAKNMPQNRDTLIVLYCNGPG